MRITIAQLNPTVGELYDNLDKLLDALLNAWREGSDLLVVPELYLVGYPPRDLLNMPWFIDLTQKTVDELVAVSSHYPGTGILLGTPWPNTITGRGLHNSAILIYDGKIIGCQHKTLLPIYDVFDEVRYFDPAPSISVIPFKDEVLGISICEDAWNDPGLWPGRKLYDMDPVSELAAQGASLLINISASPYHMGKEEKRYRLVSNHARKHRLPFIYVNQIGANDELIFDGRSMVIGADGRLIILAPAFYEHIETVDLGNPDSYVTFSLQNPVASAYQALVLGVRDYMHKSGFKQAVLGLSGGIDSALVACVACEAVGPRNVTGISMPSPFSSAGSIEDSRHLAENLGIEFKVVPISDVYNSYLHTLEPHFAGCNQDITEENIQARIRGNILMAFSNKFGSLLLSTGNKSEMSVGYCTLYGDMSGGLSVLADVPKTTVYAMARYINENIMVIPEEIIIKPPSAELRPDQLDQDTLPPYDILDQILYHYIEENLSIAQLQALGFSPQTVQWVVATVDKNEYKRRQAAPGLKITPKAFGGGRRMPIAARIQHK